MRFEVLSEGYVSQRQANTATAVAAGPRCAITLDGDLICSYMVQASLGTNDFVPLLSRSMDAGQTWVEQGSLWSHLKAEFSLFGSVSRSLAGDLFFYGTRTPIDLPGESFWFEATQGLKSNQLIWSKSADSGRTWTDPTLIPMPVLGAAEAPGAMCITRSGRWLVCYAPYNTFDPDVAVDRNQVVVLYSDNEGNAWRHTSMFRFPEVHSGAAEAWVIELADGRLLGTCWQLDYLGGQEYPNPYTLSLDRGETWQPPRSTGILGQSAAVTALKDGRVLFIYNQRKHGERGVWLAVVNPISSHFEIEANQIIWCAETVTQTGSSAEHAQWRDFSFGEPSVTVLRDNVLLVTFWCIQPSGRGIRYVRLRIVD